MATQQEIDVGTAKVRKAQSYDIPIVSEDFLNQCIQKGN